MDAIALLARHGHRVTRRPDGLYDVTRYGRAVTLAQVMDLWVAVQTWPKWVPRLGPPIRPEQFWPGPPERGAHQNCTLMGPGSDAGAPAPPEQRTESAQPGRRGGR
jgi:hypothetical protein